MAGNNTEPANSLSLEKRSNGNLTVLCSGGKVARKWHQQDNQSMTNTQEQSKTQTNKNMSKLRKTQIFVQIWKTCLVVILWLFLHCYVFMVSCFHTVVVLLLFSHCFGLMVVFTLMWSYSCFHVDVVLQLFSR